MDHQGLAQLLANYGQFIGAISVVVTLVYLAIQVRQNTRLAAIQVNNSVIEGYARFREQQNQYPFIVAKMQRGAELTEEEDVVALNLISEALFASAIAFDNSRLLERSDADRYITTATGILRRYKWPLNRNAQLLEVAGYADFVAEVRLKLTHASD
jgi:hypothetical protein